MYLISNINRTMTFTSFPTLKVHILTTKEATNLISWRGTIQTYPLPTQFTVWPGLGYKAEKVDIESYRRVGTIWPSLSSEYEWVGNTKSAKKNQYWVAQVYEDDGDDGHILYDIYGWLHIPTHHLETALLGDKPMYEYLHNLYYLHERTEKGT